MSSRAVPYRLPSVFAEGALSVSTLQERYSASRTSAWSYLGCGFCLLEDISTSWAPLAGVSEIRKRPKQTVTPSWAVAAAAAAEAVTVEPQVVAAEV